jgi:putative membrane protein
MFRASRCPPARRRGRRAWLAALTLISAFAPAAALAHEALVHEALAHAAPPDLNTLLNTWDLSPGIVIPTALALGIYAVGLMGRPESFEDRPWRHAAYFWGVFGAFMSLASPADGFSDHLFFMHQVQHMLIRVICPMLVAVSQPQAVLIAGLPGWLRRGGLGPVAGAAPVRRVFGFLTRPAPVTVLFIASLYIWQWPRLHNLAILNDNVHDAMHATMLAAGLMFFWRLFDQRPPPKGAGYGARLMMLWVAVLSNIPIGAYTTFKSRELYPAYDVVGRLFHMAPIADEQLGGFIMWAPSSMMMLIAVLLVIHAWGRHEDRQDGRRLAGVLVRATPATGEEMIVQQRPKNRALAVGLLGFAVCVLAATFTVGILDVQAHRRAPRPAGEAAKVANADGGASLLR